MLDISNEYIEQFVYERGGVETDGSEYNHQYRKPSEEKYKEEESTSRIEPLPWSVPSFRPSRR